MNPAKSLNPEITAVLYLPPHQGRQPFAIVEPPTQPTQPTIKVPKLSLKYLWPEDFLLHGFVDGPVRSPASVIDI